MPTTRILTFGKQGQFEVTVTTKKWLLASKFKEDHNVSLQYYNAVLWCFCGVLSSQCIVGHTAHALEVTMAAGMTPFFSRNVCAVVLAAIVFGLEIASASTLWYYWFQTSQTTSSRDFSCFLLSNVASQRSHHFLQPRLL
jgi:hypothetical protein